MRVGTRSLLFGAHQFAVHPWFVAAAWWKLYGFPWDPRLWVAFFVHDIGYWGKGDMDGPEGERHVELGAKVMRTLFDGEHTLGRMCVGEWAWSKTAKDHFGPWGKMCLYHSRFYAKGDVAAPSKLCAADKLSIAMTPAWLYLPLARTSGEIYEYMKLVDTKYAHMNLVTKSEAEWYADVQAKVKAWAIEHAHDEIDVYTPEAAK